jgi:hypothetical protein
MIDVKVSPPNDNSWNEALRFYCQTCEYDNPALPFMVSMWSYSISNDGLTGKQAKAAEVYIKHRFSKLNLSYGEIENG